MEPPAHLIGEAFATPKRGRIVNIAVERPDDDGCVLQPRVGQYGRHRRSEMNNRFRIVSKEILHSLVCGAREDHAQNGLEKLDSIE
jgi:hypothetical protein